jgi:hypothetical protein
MGRPAAFPAEIVYKNSVTPMDAGPQEKMNAAKLHFRELDGLTISTQHLDVAVT